jgi:riboflavin synthase
MFTGIVQGTATVHSARDHGGQRHLVLDLPPGRGAGLVPGASVAVAGVCLTAVEIDRDRVGFDIIAESLRSSVLGRLGVGDRVNVERAATFGDEIGGHLLSGHVWGTAEVVAVAPSTGQTTITLRAPADARKYILPKGYVALDGCSLTVSASVGDTFSVHLIPETLRVTTLGELSVGDRLNVEVDPMTQAVVATVERVLAARDEG